MENSINIGFIGGCAITQHNILRQNRFYSILQRRFADSNYCQPTFSFARYSHYKNIDEAYDKVMNKNNLDIIVVHVRPQPFHILSKLLIKYIDITNGKSIIINPLMFGRIMDEKREVRPPIVLNPLIKKPKFMDINILLGNIFKLNLKAAKHIFDEILIIQSRCKQSNIKLMILGIPYQPLSWIGSINSYRLNLFLKENFRKNNIGYLDCYDKMKNKEYFQKDNLHFSNKGHYVLGSVLFEGLKHFTTNNT